MKIRLRRVITAVIPLLLAACASREAFIPDPALNDENSANIVIYRPNTSFHKMEIEKPYVYLDGKQLGTLGVNRQLKTRLPEGDHLIEIKKPFLFIPTFNVGKLHVSTHPQKDYYVRYAYDYNGVMFYPGGATVQGKSSLMLVDESTGKQQQ